MNYKVYRTPQFKKTYDKIPKTEKKIIANLLIKLSLNPHQGKPLKSYNLREKRIGSRRVYYIICDDYLIVLMVSISSKKNQQETIDMIDALLPAYMDLVRKLSEK
ncbi:MAG: hypothetical protein KAI43_07305 [Candidatus Aureabacteria bacterium]|nr:hypothetical protein [Candidatus Auribacterota bacterium]